LQIGDRMLEQTTILDLSGHLVAGEESWSLRQRVREVAEESTSPRIVLNLGDVVFIDSSGVAELVASLTTAKKASGLLKLAHAQGQVQEILRLTRVDSLFDVYDSVEEASASFDVAATGQGEDS
jgi:anti-sigma B factor antagonist